MRLLRSLDEATEIESLGELFSQRYRLAAATVGAAVSEASVKDDWRAYLSENMPSAYGTPPENVFRKGWLTTEIERLVADAPGRPALARSPNGAR
jgi:hypothetical protein